MQCEKERLANANNTHMISVEDIMLEESSEDDDVPIVATLQGKKDNLSLLVNVATALISSPSLRKKKQPKVFIYYPSPPSSPHSNHEPYPFLVTLTQRFFGRIKQFLSQLAQPLNIGTLMLPVSAQQKGLRKKSCWQ